MVVVAVRETFADCPAELINAGIFASSQTLVTTNREYRVFALACSRGILWFQVVNDLQVPHWLPGWLFDVKDGSVDSDWFCNCFETDPRLLIGPRFVTRSQDSYRQMVELQPKAVDEFWARYATPQGEEKDGC